MDEEKEEPAAQSGGQSQPSAMAEGVTEEAPAFDTASVHPKRVWTTDEELKGLQKELTDYKDKYLRLLADAENMRKRLHKERQEIARSAVEGLILDFIRPLDNLENALRFAQAMSDEVKHWAFGFQMILAQFKDVLVQNGIVAVDVLGMPFNPHDHEAIEMVESAEHTPGTIVEECVKGYKLGERTLRAARVKVAKAPEKNV